MITTFANGIRRFYTFAKRKRYYTYLLALVINNLSDIQILHLTEILCRITEKFDKTFVFHQISQLDLEIIHNSREICIITNFIYRNIYITHIHIYIYIYIYIYYIYYILYIMYIIYYIFTIFTRWSCMAFSMVFWKSNERKHKSSIVKSSGCEKLLGIKIYSKPSFLMNMIKIFGKELARNCEH